MKIISNTKDYYDSALGFGHDESCVYVRQRSVDTTTISTDILPWQPSKIPSLYYFGEQGQRTLRIIDTSLPQYKAQHQTARFYESFVCVAGKAYCVFVASKGVWPHLSEHTQILGHPEAEKILNLFSQETLKNGELRYRVEDNLSKFSDSVRSSYDYARTKFLTKDFTALHLEMGAPVLLLLNPHHFKSDSASVSNNVLVVKNPNLKDLHMHNTIDPFSCFQSIEQFISGVVLGEQMPLVSISDKDMVRKKGFDPKYGFRTRPQQ